MELAELTAYAKQTWNLQEEQRWNDPAGFTVLCEPGSRRWAALLMRRWDTDSGSWLECCDIRSGDASRFAWSASWLTAPLQMRGPRWVGVRFTRETVPETVFRLLDKAVESLLASPHKAADSGAEIVLEPLSRTGIGGASDTPLPPPDRVGLSRDLSVSLQIKKQVSTVGETLQTIREALPGALRELLPASLRMTERRFGWQSPEERARDFFLQGMELKDREDRLPWTGDFHCYFPTYRDLNPRQLRGYLCWRTGARRGEYAPLPVSAAYIYLYELLNGIGTASPQDSLEKLQAFETGFLDAGFGDRLMRNNLRRWMLELAVVTGLPPETARQYADPDLLETDDALAALRLPREHDDGTVFAALCRLGGGRTADSPVVKADPARAAALFAAAWRLAAADCRRDGKNLFTLCFGPRRTRLWRPLSNAIYCPTEPPADRDCALSELRKYRCRGGRWQSIAYEADSFDRRLLQAFLRETELRLRAYLKAGRPLKPRPEDAWAGPYVDAAIEAERKALAAAARRRVEIDFSDLNRIRRDAAVTRDSLLVEDPAEEAPARSGAQCAPQLPRSDEATAPAPGLPLDDAQRAILRALLRGEDASGALILEHLTPALLADAINEALFDHFGDTVLLCENESLTIIEDYKEDLTTILGGVSYD